MSVDDFSIRRVILIKRALFWRRCVHVDRLDNEPMFERMSLDSYSRARKRLMKLRQDERVAA